MTISKKNICKINGVTHKQGDQGLIKIEFVNDQTQPKTQSQRVVRSHTHQNPNLSPKITHKNPHLQKLENLKKSTNILPTRVKSSDLTKTSTQLQISERIFSTPITLENEVLVPFPSAKSNLKNPVKQFNKKLKRHKLQDYLMSLILLIVSTAFGFGIALQAGQSNSSQPQVAGAKEVIAKEYNSEDFESWLGTQSFDESDNPNLNEDLQNSVATNPQLDAETTTDQKSILEVFGIDSQDKLNNIDVNATIQKEAENQENIAARIELAKLSQRIDQYIKTYRSYDVYDNQVATPLNGLNYIYVSEKTKTPIKYLIAISRAESRFGTDQFTNSGNKTRPGEHRNPCSIGLNDRGDNITFASFEEGLMACGKWYQYFENRGVSDCRKWRIFNPNGDYCSKIEILSSQIQRDVIDKK